jgi:hypothetical protein
MNAQIVRTPVASAAPGAAAGPMPFDGPKVGTVRSTYVSVGDGSSRVNTDEIHLGSTWELGASRPVELGGTTKFSGVVDALRAVQVEARRAPGNAATIYAAMKVPDATDGAVQLFNVYTSGQHQGDDMLGAGGLNQTVRGLGADQLIASGVSEDGALTSMAVHRDSPDLVALLSAPIVVDFPHDPKYAAQLTKLVGGDGNISFARDLLAIPPTSA